jgi:hypothetical protein
MVLDEGWSMQTVPWLLTAFLTLIVAYGLLRTAYRIIRGTVSDTLFLALLAGTALAVGYLFS